MRKTIVYAALILSLSPLSPPMARADSTDAWMAAHPAPSGDNASANSLAGQLGANARQNYSDPNAFGDMLKASQNGTGGIKDLAGNAPANNKATNYDICLLNNPDNKSVCDIDKASSDAYKACMSSAFQNCKQNPTAYSTYNSSSPDPNFCKNPNDYASDCAGMAGSLAALNFQSGCQKTGTYLVFSYIPDPSTFDITTLSVTIDPQLTGNPVVVNPLASSGHAARMSAVCSNGFISCDAGTFNNCTTYKWTDTGGGIPGITGTLSNNEVGSCYCINKSCGTNLPLLNSGQILNDISSGILGALLKTQGDKIQIVNTTSVPTQLTTTLIGALATSCAGPNGTPAVTTSNAAVNDLTSLGSKMTTDDVNAPDYLQQAGVAMQAQQNALPEPTVSDTNLLSPAQRASYNPAINYAKMMLDTSDMTVDTYKELTCNVKRNFIVTSKNTHKLGHGVENNICTDQIILAKVQQNGPTSSLSVIGSGGGFVGIYPNAAVTNPGAHCGGQSGSDWVSIDMGDMGGVITPGTVATINSTTTPTQDSPNTATSTTVSSQGIRLLNTAISVTMDTNDGGCSGTGQKFTMDGPGTGGVPGTCGGHNDQHPNIIWDWDEFFVEDISSEAINDGCASIKQDLSCSPVGQKTDGVQVSNNNIATGLTPLTSCQTQPGQAYGPYTLCRPWWDQEWTYRCTTAKPIDDGAAAIANRAGAINNSTVMDAQGNITFDDAPSDKTAGPSTLGMALTGVTDLTTPGTCDMVCKVSVIGTNTKVNAEGTASTVNTTNPSQLHLTGVNLLPSNLVGKGQVAATKIYSYMYCNPKVPGKLSASKTDWACPTTESQTLEVDCGCPNDFGSSIGTITAVLAAAKSATCTTGATGPVQ